MDPVFAIMRKEQVDFGRTWDATRVLFDRLMRGEFLVRPFVLPYQLSSLSRSIVSQLFFSESARIDRINPLFQPEFVDIPKQGASSTIQRSLRPVRSSFLFFRFCRSMLTIIWLDSLCRRTHTSSFQSPTISRIVDPVRQN